MKLTALSIALIAALGAMTGCSTQNTTGLAANPAATAADAQAQYALGRYYQGQQRYELAIESYRRALAANPAHVSAHNGLGASLLLAGRTDEAIEQFKAGLQHQPRSAALWNNLGYAYALSGESKLAELAYKQSLDLDPTDYKTNTNLAAVQQAAPEAAPAPVAATPAPAAKIESVKTAAVEVRSVPLYQAPASAEPPTPAKAAAALPAPEPAVTRHVQAQAAPQPIAEAAPAPVAVAERTAPVAPATSVQPPVELTVPATAVAPAVQVVEVAPRVYEMNLDNTRPVTTVAAQSLPAPVAGATRISVPLREDVMQTAAVDASNFMLEIRNGNGVHRMAYRTSQYLAGHGYTTNYLSNQRGFDVKLTQVLHLPGYLEEAKRLLAYLPKGAVLTETTDLGRGAHIRVVLGKDMVQQGAGKEAVQTASLDGSDFVLEIRNGNGVRRMALHTSQYLAGYGYTTNRLTNQRGFDVKVTQVLYLPGYLEEAKQLLAHLPKDAVLKETNTLRPGTHVRVVLGKDMA